MNEIQLFVEVANSVKQKFCTHVYFGKINDTLTFASSVTSHRPFLGGIYRMPFDRFHTNGQMLLPLQVHGRFDGFETAREKRKYSQIQNIRQEEQRVSKSKSVFL